MDKKADLTSKGKGEYVRLLALGRTTFERTESLETNNRTIEHIFQNRTKKSSRKSMKNYKSGFNPFVQKFEKHVVLNQPKFFC